MKAIRKILVAVKNPDARRQAGVDSAGAEANGRKTVRPQDL